MKRVFLVLFCLLGCLFSCNKMNEDNYPDLILGKWQIIKEEVYYDGKLDETNSLDGTWFFSSSGDCIEENDRSKYTITAQWLTLEYERYTVTVKIQKFTRKELILVGSEHDREEVWVYFERIE